MEPRIEPCGHSAHTPLSSLTGLLTEHWLPGPQVGREMSDPQAQLGISWRSHQQSNHQRLLDSINNQGNRRYSIFGENIKLTETGKSYSILSFNWKEENLLKKKLSFLESMKKYEANARLMEQKAFYKRCHSKLQRSELAHARLLGNKDLVKRLTSKNMLSSYTTTFVDDSEAAVKAIVQNRGWENMMLFRLSLDKDRLCSALNSDLLKKVEAQAAPRAILKADSKKESVRTTVKISRSPSRGEGKPALVLSLESLESPEQGEKQRKPPVDSSPLPEGEGITRDFSSRPSSIVQSHLQDPAIGRKSKCKLLQYIVYGDRSVELPKKKRPRPRNNSHGPEDVQMDPAMLTHIQAILRQEFLMKERAKYLEDTIQSLPQSTHFHFQDYSSHSPLKKGSERVLRAPGIRMHGAGRGQKMVLEEIGKQIGGNSITRKNENSFF
nr:uncharacterized protein LOC106833243 [Equus asinus]